MNPKARQIVLAALVVGLAVWATPAWAGFISAHDALGQAGSESALAALGVPELPSAGPQAAPAPQLPPQDEEQDGRPLAAPNHLRPLDSGQPGMTAPSASSLGGSAGATSPAMLCVAPQAPQPNLAARLPGEMGLFFSPPLPWTPLRPPRAC